ncbi:MAG TPA: hypothetical protein VMD74_00025, partial [Candidatus Methylomirabilis sp.]|nr:hypothetical protein [Candidatus Methylomirabilis sp.]
MWEKFRNNKEVAVFIAFLIIGLAVYANSFGNRFFWDDDDVVVKNIYVHNFQLDKFFSQNEIAGSFGQISNYWRPLLLISFAVDYKVWGLSPFGFHLTNTLLHVFAAWLVFILLYQLIELLRLNKNTPHLAPPEADKAARDTLLNKGDYLLAFLPALFFLIHPLQTEAVTYVAGRGEPLSAVLSLLSLIFYLVFRTDGRKKFFFWALIFFAGGILVKEQTVYLPLIVLLIELVFFLKNFPQDIGKIVKNTAAFFALAAIYLAARLTILNFNHILSGSVNFVSAAYHQSIWQRAYTFCLAVWNYLRLLFVPTGLHMEWQITP